MHLGRLAISLTLLVLVIGVAPAVAGSASPTVLTLRASPGHAGEATHLRIDLSAADGGPLAGLVEVERRVGGRWTAIATVVTDADGHAVVDATLRKRKADNAFRATYAGDDVHDAATSGVRRAALVKRKSVVDVGGPKSVVDERRVTLRVRWTTRSGEPVAGKVRLYRKDAGRRHWRKVRTLRTGADGKATLRMRPRVDTRWRARARAKDWVKGDRSRVHRVDNLPPGRPVRLPRAAPRPRVHLPPQHRATRSGAHAVVSRIPGGVWRQMTGRTWHHGCPVGRAGLRLVRVNYWGYDGYRYRGELVAAASAARRMAAALAEMYARKLPIRSMYRVDRFGWSARLHGGDDYRSMAAGNTSAFNCRQVVNRPGVRSPHSYGRSLDLNTWENPYRSPTGLVPNSWWQRHSHPRVAWRSRSHAVVRIMARHGLRWTYGRGDTQHFDATGAHGRVRAYPGCGDVVCD